MEKIIIACSARHLAYEFPKRKWYQFRNRNRIALMRLDSAREDELDLAIDLQIYEDDSQEFSCQINQAYQSDICEAILRQYHTKHHLMEHVIVLDDDGDIIPDLLYRLAENRNYLSILTARPEKYEQILDKIAMDFGLFGMVFSEKKEFILYIKQILRNKKALVLAGESGSDWLYHFPKDSLFMDFSSKGIHRSLIFQKRMRFTYVSIPIFLDNIVQNRYNAIVNEGITFQVINDKKTIWRRKGNNDGRKEEYSDL